MHVPARPRDEVAHARLDDRHSSEVAHHLPVGYTAHLAVVGDDTSFVVAAAFGNVGAEHLGVHVGAEPCFRVVVVVVVAMMRGRELRVEWQDRRVVRDKRDRLRASQA